MSEDRTILIGRCSFWPESRDPEAWLRALVVLSNASANAETETWTGPRAIGDKVLRGHLSRRGVPGLFGLDDSRSPAFLDGVGILELDPERFRWQLSTEGHHLLATWQAGSHREALEALALLLLRRSVWLRLAVLKFQSGEWQLNRWDKLKSSNGQMRPGKHLLLGKEGNPSVWLAGIEAAVLGAWWAELSGRSPFVIKIHAPKTAKPDDGLSLSPLKSPLYLLDSLGWFDATGQLNLPPSSEQDPILNSLKGNRPSAQSIFERLTGAFADPRGVFPLEPVMLRFGEAIGLFPHASAKDSKFVAWADRLLSELFRTGALELISAEPGQPRHGRGLFGDPHQKLLRWKVHPGFDEICGSLATEFRQPEREIAI